jgi:hypothetical protein
MESSSPLLPDDYARLVSGLFNDPANNEYCMEFWYHMNGFNVKDLNIWKLQDGTETILWTKYGSHGPQWNHGMIHIAEVLPYQVG